MKYWLICYDISDNKNRYYVEATLQAYGERVQYSVFECAITKDNIHAVLTTLAVFVEPTDSLICLPICRWCKSKANTRLWSYPCNRGFYHHMSAYRVIISFDISDDKRRRQVIKQIEAYGHRLQWSVFECQLKPAQLNKLQRQLDKLITQQDRIHYHPLCRKDRRQVLYLGKPIKKPCDFHII